MNYEELLKELAIAVAGMSKEDLQELNMLEWIKDNLTSGYDGCKSERPMQENMTAVKASDLCKKMGISFTQLN